MKLLKEFAYKIENNKSKIHREAYDRIIDNFVRKNLKYG
jgi:predicted transglutaminase-like protease